MSGPVLDNGWSAADIRVDVWLRDALDRAKRRARLSGWTVLQSGEDGASFARDGISLSHRQPPRQTVILSGGHREDGQWFHVSTAWSNRLPTFDELREVREVFLDDSLVAVQVFPPKAEYINIHPFCLHLYARFYPRTVPDLRLLGQI